MPAGDGEQHAFDERLRRRSAAARRRRPAAPPFASRRATARASSRFATFAQAISSTSPQTASRICRLRPYSSFITPTPAPAGTTVMVCLGSMRIDVGHPVGRVAGVVLHPLPQDCRSSRGAMPSTEAPGRSRPITRSHAETGWRSSEPPPAISGSCCSGIQRSGGLPRSVSPKNPGGAMPMTVNGCPSTTKVEPTTEGSPP